MEPVPIPTDDDIQEAASAFAAIIDPGNPKFQEDFEIGAKWMRRKMREAYEKSPLRPRKKKPKSS